MDYVYRETVDWGIIKREWIYEDPDYFVILEKHEEDRYTVLITHKRQDLEYYSYWLASGKLTFESLEAAQSFAETRLEAIKQGDFSHCTGKAVNRGG